MIDKRIVLVLALASLAACSGPTEAERKQLDSLIGKTEVDVVRTYGVPTRTFMAQDRLFLAYIDNQTSYSPGS
ncbi:MAG: hypothetical protein ABF824_05760, partial [Acetobacter sp.]